ncbi:hypothetical protein EDB84DRAFT_1480896 [Lactarius hengduanensis]|nr:hypothetical protein EDB84DRAFT_1480896 [Lactarius hengduanensis]
MFTIPLASVLIMCSTRSIIMTHAKRLPVAVNAAPYCRDHYCKHWFPVLCANCAWATGSSTLDMITVPFRLLYCPQLYSAS